MIMVIVDQIVFFSLCTSLDKISSRAVGFLLTKAVAWI